MLKFNEKYLEDYPTPISYDKTKIILKQMKNSVCKVCKNDGSKGTGFFCKIPINNYKLLPVFITNNHIINKNDLNKGNNIVLQFNAGQDNNNIKLLSTKNKYIYTNNEYDITIIEIDENDDNIYEYLELDDNIFKDTTNYIGNSIYIMHYPKQNNVSVSYGILKKIDRDEQYNFCHFCSTEYGSSGSPILNLSNNKVIGIHCRRSSTDNNNIGSFLYYSLIDFIRGYKNKREMINKSKTFTYFTPLINKDKHDKITELFIKLKNKGLATDIIEKKNPYKYGGWCDFGYTPPIHISEKRIIISNQFLPYNWNNWIPAWHGTKYQYLESIIENGLQLPGTHLKSGINTPNAKDIPFTNDVLGIRNWENAIFASPNIHYALKYCDIIDKKKDLKDLWSQNIMPIPENWGWKGVLKIRIRPNSFTKHKSEIVINYFGGHMSNQGMNQIDDIYRITSENDIIIESIVFINECDILASNICLNNSIK